MDYEYNQLQYQQQTGVLITEDEKQMGLYLHLSALANLIIPFAGYVLPIVIWQTKKGEMPAIDAHGKEAANWMISSFIYTITLIVLLIVGVILGAIAEAPGLIVLVAVLSVLALVALSILNIAYAVIAGVKANSGDHWEYPLNIRLIK